MIQLLRKKLKSLESAKDIHPSVLKKANMLYISGQCQILSHSSQAFEILVEDENEGAEVKITLDEDEVYCQKGIHTIGWDSHALAALMQLVDELEVTEPKPILEGKKYTREGMIKRVMEERKEKAAKAEYRITYANNLYGEHILLNEKGEKFKITLRDFANETGYINNADLRTNKLGTTKHLMYAFNDLKSRPEFMATLENKYPFVEIYLDPLNEYRITWHYPHPLTMDVGNLITVYFGGEKYINDSNAMEFMNFITEALTFPQILIRPEVEDKVKKAWDNEMFEIVRREETPDLSLLKVNLFPYQSAGVKFAAYRASTIIADEMGLGKTIQAIGTAVVKKQLFGFRRTLVVCPASLKQQWQQEIAKFCHEEAVVVEGTPEVRAAIYRETKAYFVIVNYETVLRDIWEINKMETDFVILDEAQKIKNFSTVTAQNIKKLKRKHALVITGTPIENRLIDLYSIVDFVDPNFLAPLWEFSYQHCLFDERNKSKITGYYNLQGLNERLKPILLRREKRKVLSDLPNVVEMMVPVNLHPDQADYHAGFAAGVASILAKKFITPYDQQKLMLLLNNMRMVCDSTFLIDKETYISPKLTELKHILVEKFDVKNKDCKIIIFSEWVTMLHLIGKMLHELGIGFVQLSGKVAVKNRGQLVKKFETDPKCKIFLSSEAGGAGLNLQVADTVVNFELPWNPAKKNQRIGRIDRLGQLSKKLTVINFISKNSIEMKIASGLNLKQNLFDGVLNDGSGMDYVDFSASGRSQFLQEIEAMINEFTNPMPVEEETTVEHEIQQTVEEMLETSVEEELAIAAEVPNGQNEASGDAGNIETMEKAMNQGMEFLSSMIKMATGKDMGLEGQKIEVNKETGEVVMKFKLPGFK